MNGMNPLMRYARARGDGLLPELEALLCRPQPDAGAANVVDFAAIRGLPQQAGPNPVGELPDNLPENVVVFRPAVPGKPPQRETSTVRAPRKPRAPKLMKRKD